MRGKRTLQQKWENWIQSRPESVEDIPSIRWRNIITLNQERSDSGKCPKRQKPEIQCSAVCFSVLFFFLGPRESLQSACQHSWYVSRSLYAACSPGSIFKMLENKWVWMHPAAFICFMVKIQRNASDTMVIFPWVFFFQIDYIVCFFILFFCQTIITFTSNVKENYLCICICAWEHTKLTFEFCLH